jgi:probable phosphoglycerate mutase
LSEHPDFIGKVIPVRIGILPTILTLNKQYCLIDRIHDIIIFIQENYINRGEIIIIYLVRQGETDWNLFKRANGVTDTFLNRTGIAQAKLQADNLRNIYFDVCFCSPQTRVRQTCEIIYKGSIVFDDRLNEINLGEFEGVDETDAEIWKLALQAIMIGDKGTVSFEDFMKRNCDFCDMIVKDHKGENVLIVTTAGNLRVIDYYFKGKPMDYDFTIRTLISNGELLTYKN